MSRFFVDYQAGITPIAILAMFIVAFVAFVIYVYNPRNKSRFQRESEIPLNDDK